MMFPWIALISYLMILYGEKKCLDETQVILDIQEAGLCTKHAESAERDHNISGDREDLSHKVDTDRSSSFDIINEDNHDTMSLSSHLYADKGIEEGEISVEFMDIVTERKDLIGIEPGVRNANDLMPLLTDTVEDVEKDMKGAVNKRTRSLVDYSEIAVHGRFRESPKQMATEQVLPLQCILKDSATKNQDLVYSSKDANAQNNRKRQGPLIEKYKTNKKAKKSVDPQPVSENLRLLEDTSKDVVDASANKDATNEKKKKRTLTKERKAKKKWNERIKRAEKNRKLGVKRLKLEPVIREKKVTYCRHYLKGRCNEGEKCKFSHDTVPLTKSKPCCHFARHACMKGDDCPFDHQLSKYPCNNHMTKGFCSRGSDCMFSHEAQPTEALVNASNELKSDQKPPSSSGSETVDTKSCSLPIFVASNTERNFVNTTPKLPVRPPKGISFLPREKLPLESQPSPKVDGEVKEITKTPPVIQNFKEITKTTAIVPLGINFLSFGKKPSLDHSNIGYFIKMNNATGKPQFSNLEGSGSGSKSESSVDGMTVDIATDRPNSYLKPVPLLPFMSSASQKALQSTLDFALKFESGLKTKRL